jgi:hypothetical protein
MYWVCDALRLSHRKEGKRNSRPNGPKHEDDGSHKKVEQVQRRLMLFDRLMIHGGPRSTSLFLTPTACLTGDHNPKTVKMGKPTK